MKIEISKLKTISFSLSDLSDLDETIKNTLKDENVLLVDVKISTTLSEFGDITHYIVCFLESQNIINPYLS